MYGQAIIELEPPSKNLTIPASAVIDQNTKGEGTVYVVVKDGKVERRKVRSAGTTAWRLRPLTACLPDDEAHRSAHELDSRRG